jgi:hypothetical protein
LNLSYVPSLQSGQEVVKEAPMQGGLSMLPFFLREITMKYDGKTY